MTDMLTNLEKRRVIIHYVQQELEKTFLVDFKSFKRDFNRTKICGNSYLC